MLNKDIKTMKTTNWTELGIKDKLAIASACAAFTMGWLLTAIAAFVPLLLSEQGILWILGQSLVYSASVFGVSMYFKSESVQMRKDMQDFLNEKEKLMNERMKIRQGLDKGEIPNEDDDV